MKNLKKWMSVMLCMCLLCGIGEEVRASQTAEKDNLVSEDSAENHRDDEAEDMSKKTASEGDLSDETEEAEGTSGKKEENPSDNSSDIPEDISEDMELQEYIKQAQSALEEVEKEEPLMALVYLCESYSLKKKPDPEGESIVKFPSGSTVFIKGVGVDEEFNLWYQVTGELNGNAYTGYIQREYLAYSNELFLEWEDSYFPKMAMFASTSSLYPDVEQFPDSYKDKLMRLKQAHPNWIFVRQNTNLEWQKVVSAENYKDRNLISSSQSAAWRGDYYGQGWYYASEGAVKYYLDPRNFLDDTRIFQFEQLTYNSSYHTKAAVQNILSNTFMKGQLPKSDMTYADAFFKIGVSLKVSPFHLACRVYQEQGKGTSPLISGNYDVVPEYKGYYNYFNIGASGTTDKQVIESGLARALKEGWNTPYASLNGGAGILSVNYILRGQDTLYLQKFDVDASDGTLYTHQYMQNIMAPYTESSMVKKAYAETGALDNPFVFKIPVYNNMPQTACPVPTATPTPTASATPTSKPTAAPTATASAAPTSKPTAAPTATASAVPTSKPTATPTPTASAMPTSKPTATASATPMSKPTATPAATDAPTLKPTATPAATDAPTLKPTATPAATVMPTAKPTAEPTATATAMPTAKSTAEPLAGATTTPTAKPMAEPTAASTVAPTAKPTAEPTATATATPTAKPTATPTATATTAPTTVAAPTATTTPTAAPTPTATATPTPAAAATPTATARPTATAAPTAKSNAAPAETSSTSSAEHTDTQTQEPVQNSGNSPETTALPVSTASPAASVEETEGASANVNSNTSSAGVTVTAATPKPYTEAGEKKTVSMDMSKTGMIYAQTIQQIKEQEMEVELKVGDKASWFIDGSAIENDGLGDINLGVTFGESRIPKEKLEILAGNEKYIEMSLAHEGEFGFTMVLSVKLEEIQPGQYANLFYYNEETGDFEFMCASLIGSAGNANFEFSHASDYVIIISAETKETLLQEKRAELEEEKAREIEALAQAKEELPAEEPGKAAGIIVLILLGSAAIGIAVYLIMKGKDER